MTKAGSPYRWLGRKPAVGGLRMQVTQGLVGARTVPTSLSTAHKESNAVLFTISALITEGIHASTLVLAWGGSDGGRGMGLRGGTEANKDITGLYDLSALHLCDRSGLSNPADLWFSEVPGASWRAPHKKVSELDGSKRGRARLVPRVCLMSIDRSKPISVKAGDPIFLLVTAGMTVIVRHLPEVGREQDEESWWMADVIHVDGGARNPKVPTLFQVADVDDGTVRWINADLVSHIVPRI